MDEKDLEVLRKLVETPNITKAAQELFTTQPSLTKRVQKIENELGCRLFVRSKKGLYPLPAVEQIMPKIENAVKAFSEIRDEAALFSGRIAGTLKAGVSINFAHYELPALLKRYIQKYPFVRVSLWANQSSVIYQRFQKGEYSVAILRGEYPWEEGDVVLSREPLCLVRNFETAQQPLDALPYIARKSDAQLEEQLARWRAEQGLLPMNTQSLLSVNDIATCIALVRHGIGWALLPQICLQDFKGVVEPLRFKDGARLTRTTHLLYREASAKLPQVQAFIEETIQASRC